MGDVRDPERDQAAPRPGRIPVQAFLIEALKERMEYGRKKYGRPLETENGRDPLRDAWEEMLDLMLYFTQFVLEQGAELPGLEKFTNTPEPKPESWRGASADLFIEDELPASLAKSEGAGGLSQALGAAVDTVSRLGPLIPAICPTCRHEPHAPGHCRSKALNLGCGCLCE